MKKLITYPTMIIIAIMAFSSCQTGQPTQSVANCDLLFSHHVFFWLNDPDNPEDRAAFERGVAELLTIPEIRAYHLGVPAPVEERPVVEASYTYSYLVFFDDIEGHDIYQDHPIHSKFVEEYSYLWDRVVVYDSVMD